MTLDYLNQPYIADEQLALAESNISTFLQSLGIEILSIYVHEFIKPHRIAMDDVEGGDTVRMVASGEIIVDVCVKSKQHNRVFMRCLKYENENFFNWEVTTETDIYFIVKNKQAFYKFKKEYLT